MPNDPGDPHSLAPAPVVVGVDGTDAADLAVRWAAEAAADRRRELVIVHGTDLATARGPFGAYPVEEFRSAIGEIGGRILRDAWWLAEQTAPTVTAHTRLDEGDPAELLIELSATAHMVVLGGPTDSTGLGRLGSILLSVVSRASGTVAVVRDGKQDLLPRTGPVVVGVDGSPVSEAATAVAFREAATLGAPLVAVHSWADPYAGRFSRLLESAEEPVDVAAPERALLAERLAGWQERYPSVTVEREVARGTARDQLLIRAESARLLVVGSRGRGRFARFMLGSTSATLVQRARCPVLVVHPR